MKKDKIITSIASLLPEGLDESVLTKIADLLADKIQEEVKTQVESLTTKVTSFIRGNIERLKEHAVKELELENPTFRNAQLFETMRSMMALEVTPEDEVTGAGILASIGEAQEEKIEVLVNQVNNLLKENTELKRTVKLRTDESSKLKESVAKLNEDVQLAKKDQTKHMSDKGIVVSAQNFKVQDTGKDEQQKKPRSTGNEWLNEGILNANKKLNIRG